MNYTDNNVMLFKKNIYLEVKELFFSNIFKLKQYIRFCVKLAIIVIYFDVFNNKLYKVAITVTKFNRLLLLYQKNIQFRRLKAQYTYD